MRKVRLFRQWPIIVRKVLGRRREKVVKALTSSVVSGSDEIWAGAGGCNQVLNFVGLHLRSLEHEKPVGVRKPGRGRTDKHQLADVRRVAKRKVERNLTAMRAGD